jgi:glutamate/tyrosine decarboxylase-like PLP-dependent enzyme
MDNHTDRSSSDSVLKSFFLGPKAENAAWVKEMVIDVFDQWVSWRRTHYKTDGRAVSEEDQATAEFQNSLKVFRSEIDELLQRFQSELPSFSPRYIGHMITEVSLPALLGHIVTLLYNPNNISEEVSRVGIQIENNAIGSLLAMVGLKQSNAAGHFTSGGTVANLEGALRARARCLRWLNAGACARKLGMFEGSIVEASTMGWDQFDNLLQHPDVLRLYEEKTFDLLYQPFVASRAIEQVFGESYLGPVVLVPGNKHYSWNKAVDILGLGAEAFVEVRTDQFGRLDPVDLNYCITQARDAGRPVIMIVSVVGTTELGEVDPVDEIAALLDSWRENEGLDIWHHVDAAYGGFFCTLRYESSEEILSESVKNALRAMYRANSITIDPHKLGFVPYASGAFLCRNRRDYAYTRVEAPYLDFRSQNEAGITTVEGSRSAAGAVSTWLTARVIGFDAPGYGRLLSRSVIAAGKMGHGLKQAHSDIRVTQARDTNIVTFCVARQREAISTTNKRTLNLFNQFSAHKENVFFVSKTALNLKSYEALLRSFVDEWQATWDTDTLILLRMVLINPFLDTRKSDTSYIDSFIREVVSLIDS